VLRGRFLKYKRGDCLGVTWFDAFQEPETWTLNSDIDLDADYKVFSTGFYYGESKEYLVIVGDVGNGRSGRVIHIPFGMVKRVQRFKC
jgi:hypothetical protein